MTGAGAEIHHTGTPKKTGMPETVMHEKTGTAQIIENEYGA